MGEYTDLEQKMSARIRELEQEVEALRDECRLLKEWLADCRKSR